MKPWMLSWSLTESPQRTQDTLNNHQQQQQQQQGPASLHYCHAGSIEQDSPCWESFGSMVVNRNSTGVCLSNSELFPVFVVISQPPFPLSSHFALWQQQTRLTSAHRFSNYTKGFADNLPVLVLEWVQSVVVGEIKPHLSWSRRSRFSRSHNQAILIYIYGSDASTVGKTGGCVVSEG